MHFNTKKICFFFLVVYPAEESSFKVYLFSYATTFFSFSKCLSQIPRLNISRDMLTNKSGKPFLEHLAFLEITDEKLINGGKRKRASAFLPVRMKNHRLSKAQDISYSNPYLMTWAF